MKKLLLSLLGVLISIPAFALFNHYIYFIPNPLFEQYRIDFQVISEEEKTCKLISVTPAIPFAIEIPSTVKDGDDDFTVVAIEARGFSSKRNIPSIVLPNTVTSVGDNAFSGCTSLTSVVLPNSLTSIGNDVFNGCSKLKDLEIPATVRSIGSGAFYGCSSLTAIELPQGLSSIGNSAFQGCPGLSGINIPQSVTSIGANAFAGCSGLTSFTIPNSVTSLGEGAFRGCSKLTSLTLSNKLTAVPAKLFQDCTSLGSYKIPNTISAIGDYAFAGCTHLLSIDIPSSVNSVGAYAFSGCSGLPSVVLPSNIKVINDGTFQKCTAMTSFKVPDPVTSIGAYAFNGCSGLASITIPESVTSIGAYAYAGCQRLGSFGIPSKLDSISDGTFQNCSTLTSIRIPDAVVSIGNSAFNGCSNLAAITIPGSVTSIGSAAFAGCGKISAVSSLPSIPPIMNDDSFSGIYDTAVLTVPEESFYKYIDTNWSLFKNIQFGTPAVVTTTYSDGYLNYRLIPATKEGENNTAIVVPGDYADLTEATVPQRFSVDTGGSTVTRYYVESIGYEAFKDCTQLKSIIFHNRNTSKTIGAYAFAGSGITSISIPASIESIGENAFLNTSDLSEITLPAGLNTIGTDAFKDSNCGKVNISDIKAWCGIDFANEYANPLNSGTLYFNGEKVTDLQIPNLTPEIKKYAFYNADSLTSVTLGCNVASIGEQAFYNCTGMTEVVMAPSTETIGASAFAGNTNLATIVMGHSVKSIGEMAFDGCPAATVSITTQTPPTASNNTFSRYTGKFYVQGEQTADDYYDSYICWDRFDPELLTEPTGMDINSKTIEGKPGETVQLTATLQPQNVSLPYIFWSSSNPEVATVDENGLVTIHKTPGEATPAAEDQESSGSCRITAESLYADGPVAVVEIVDKTAGISDVTADGVNGGEIDFNAPLEIYTMQGMAAGHDINSLSKGIYIVRQGCIVRKIVVR